MAEKKVHKARINGIRQIPTEDEEQIAVISWARLMACRYPELNLLHHIPNGGLRSKREAAIFRAMGVTPGVPDLFLPTARGGYHGLYVEMKALDGRVSAAQREMMQSLGKQGYKCAVCYGADEAIREIESYLRGGVLCSESYTAATALR